MLYNTNRFFTTLADLKDLLKDYDVKVTEVKAQTGYISRKTRALTERDNTPVFVAIVKASCIIYSPGMIQLGIVGDVT